MKNSWIYFGIFQVFCASTLFGSPSYEEWLGQNQAQYQTYKKSLDEEFANGLKKEWEIFKSGYYENPYAKPKPKIVPKVEEQAKKKPQKTKENLLKATLVPQKEIKPQDIGLPKQAQIEIPKITKTNNVNFEFFGSNIDIAYDDKFFADKQSLKSSNDIAKFYEQISKTNYKHITSELEKIAKKLSLNDWGKFLLADKFANEICKNDKNSSNAFTWFLLLKQNFDVKIAIDDAKNLILLGNFEQKLYQVSYVTVDKKAYFVLSPDGKSAKISSLLTYDVVYSKNLSAISSKIKYAIALEENIVDKTLRFKYNSNEYNIKAKYNRNSIEFFKTFPQTDYKVYFDAEEPSYLNDLVLQLRNYIEEMDEVSAVNFLLRFTQTSFNYKTDTEQFSHEKVMLPEETIFYPFSDCEDRSIMFSYLVKSILGLKVVGVKFNDHLATAVKLNTKIDGDSFLVDGERFYIADPTYINANIGMIMPQYKNSKFLLIN